MKLNDYIGGFTDEKWFSILNSIAALVFSVLLFTNFSIGALFAVMILAINTFVFTSLYGSDEWKSRVEYNILASEFNQLSGFGERKDPVDFYPFTLPWGDSLCKDFRELENWCKEIVKSCNTYEQKIKTMKMKISYLKSMKSFVFLSNRQGKNSEERKKKLVKSMSALVSIAEEMHADMVIAEDDDNDPTVLIKELELQKQIDEELAQPFSQRRR